MRRWMYLQAVKDFGHIDVDGDCWGRFLSKIAHLEQKFPKNGQNQSLRTETNYDWENTFFQYSGPVVTWGGHVFGFWSHDLMRKLQKFHLRSSSSYTMVLFSGVWRLISSSRTHFLKLCHFGISHQVPSVPQTFRKNQLTRSRDFLHKLHKNPNII